MTSRSNIDQVELAKQTLDVFRERGEDFSDVRHVIHYFYGGNFAGLGAALVELGYEVRNTVDDDGVVAERYEAIGEEWRQTTLMALAELSDTYGVEYDGWEASMTRQADQKPEARPKTWLSKMFGKR
jgi:hypothetical protein